MDPQSNTPNDASQPPDPPPPAGPRRIPSAELFAEAQEIHIQHEGETYRLRKTRTGKLILTK